MSVTKTRQLPLFEQFFAGRRFSSALTFSPDGAQVLFASNISGQFNLWRVPVEGGWPDQLTAFSDETVRGAGLSPRDGTIVLCADHDGDEFHQLYVIQDGKGWPEQLTNEPQVQHFVGNAAWSPDGTKFAYAANARKPTDMECWVRDAESGQAEPVFGEGMFSFPGPFSPDGSKLLTLVFRNNSDMSIHLVDLDAGGSRELTRHEDEALFVPGPWAADGSGFYLVTDAGSEFRGLAIYDVGQDSYEWIEEPTQDVDDIANCPQVAARDMLIEIDDPAWGPTRVLGQPIKTTGSPPPRRDAPPKLGDRASPAAVAPASCYSPLRRIVPSNTAVSPSPAMPSTAREPPPVAPAKRPVPPAIVKVPRTWISPFALGGGVVPS